MRCVALHSALRVRERGVRLPRCGRARRAVLSSLFALPCPSSTSPQPHTAAHPKPQWKLSAASLQYSSTSTTASKKNKPISIAIPSPPFSTSSQYLGSRKAPEKAVQYLLSNWLKRLEELLTAWTQTKMRTTICIVTTIGPGGRHRSKFYFFGVAASVFALLTQSSLG